jgi:Polyketide cyclase / dehydrase and lipid transport
MAAIRKEISIDVPAAAVWDALRDFPGLHRRLAAGFALEVRMDGGDRLVTFFTGTVLRERLVDLDDHRRRLSWTIVDGPYSHHSASAQVFADGPGRSRFVWIADLLPDEAAAPTSEMMDLGIRAVKATLEAAASSAA